MLTAIGIIALLVRAFTVQFWIFHQSSSQNKRNEREEAFKSQYYVWSWATPDTIMKWVWEQKIDGSERFSKCISII